MTEQLAAREMNPDAGFVIQRRPGEKEERVTGGDLLEQSRATAEHRSVHSRSESAGSAGR